MARRKGTKDETHSPAPRLLAVQAIFDPAGDIHVRAVAPSGNVYEVAPRVSFRVADEDVDWFFHVWEWQHRQCLSRVEEYQPRRAQFDNGAATRLAPKPEAPVLPAVVATAEPVVDEEPITEPVVAPEPVIVPELDIEPEPVVEAGEDETAEDKE